MPISIKVKLALRLFYHFNSNKIEKLSNSNLKIEIVENANHSLDIEEFDTTNSILALSRVVEKLQEALKTIQCNNEIIKRQPI